MYPNMKVLMEDLTFVHFTHAINEAWVLYNSQATEAIKKFIKGETFKHFCNLAPFNVLSHIPIQTIEQLADASEFSHCSSQQEWAVTFVTKWGKEKGIIMLGGP